MKRVAQRVSSKNRLAERAFVHLGQRILQAATKEEVKMPFEVMQGKRPLKEALAGMSNHSVLTKYAKEHAPTAWAAAKYWSDWWMREKHLSM